MGTLGSDQQGDSAGNTRPIAASDSSVTQTGPMASTLVEILYYSSLHKIQTPLPPQL